MTLGCLLRIILLITVKFLIWVNDTWSCPLRIIILFTAHSYYFHSSLSFLSYTQLRSDHYLSYSSLHLCSHPCNFCLLLAFLSIAYCLILSVTESSVGAFLLIILLYVFLFSLLIFPTVSILLPKKSLKASWFYFCLLCMYLFRKYIPVCLKTVKIVMRKWVTVCNGSYFTDIIACYSTLLNSLFGDINNYIYSKLGETTQHIICCRKFPSKTCHITSFRCDHSITGCDTLDLCMFIQ